MFGLSPVQILIVLAITLLLFGAKRLPEMARGLGSGLREFKDGIAGQLPAGEADRVEVERHAEGAEPDRGD